MYEVYFTRKSEKELEKLAHRDAAKILARLRTLTYPFPKNLDIKKLTSAEGFYRLRAGKIRVLLELDFEKEQIWVRKVGYRGGFYHL